ncbi:hypothetical protein pipiens_015246 [Culex pipiens pipiens]|uniref:Uncharacterized protein n=1 Tax=Culex pipiens pipiens TaxID=38569 RepID=A0ABD1CRI0_CULPP
MMKRLNDFNDLQSLVELKLVSCERCLLLNHYAWHSQNIYSVILLPDPIITTRRQSWTVPFFVVLERRQLSEGLAIAVDFNLIPHLCVVLVADVWPSTTKSTETVI